MKPKTSYQCKRIIILDTSALLAGFDPFSFDEEQVTTPLVEEEIKRNTIILTRFRMAIEAEKLKVRAPSNTSLKKVRMESGKVGDSYLLSETDIELLSLAVELKESGFVPQLVTDDYSIQNVATQQGIEFLALATLGIKRLLEWVRYCPGCYRQYPANDPTKECLVCGTMLRRKPLRTLKNVKSNSL